MRHAVVRRGRTSMLWLLLGGAAAAVCLLLLLLQVGGPGRAEPSRQVSMYCAAGLRAPVEEVAAAYEREYGIRVELVYGGSNTLLSQIEVNKFDTGDLFLAADDFYAERAHEKGLAAERLPIGHMRPVIAVRRGNPKAIATVRDLLREDITVVVADPDQAAIGLAARESLERVDAGGTNLWQQLAEHVTRKGAFKPTVSDVASDVKLGSADAGIVWDATVAMPGFAEDLQAIAAEELAGGDNTVAVSVLNASRRPTEALRFARYLAARDRGLPAFERFGLTTVEGDAWAEQPQINFFCGAVNRRAMERIVADFQQREGVVVNTIYDGCGILTSRMKTIDGQRPESGFPDVYMACDVYYLDNVQEWFQEAAQVSDTEIVIAVPKGSTRVKQLSDLVAPGIRVAVGEPDQCTIGALTRRLLVAEGLYEALQEKQQQPGEVVVEKSSSALLVPDVLTGHVDAAVAYITDVQASRDQVDIVQLDSEMKLAVQPLSIARTSEHKQLVRRLFEKVADSADAFENAGFHFRLGKDRPTDPPGGDPP